jgi:hypothetical protein
MYILKIIVCRLSEIHSVLIRILISVLYFYIKKFFAVKLFGLVSKRLRYNLSEIEIFNFVKI